jgi:DNA polymerase II small subunit
VNRLHTPEAEPVEYLLLAGDMVEGVGVYPDQDEELEIVDIYEQYEAFAEHLKEVPADTEIVMIPGNHDAVRLAEPQPGFNDEIRSIMDVHDARIVSNPATYAATADRPSTRSDVESATANNAGMIGALGCTGTNV